MKIDINDFKGQQENGLNDCLNLLSLVVFTINWTDIADWLYELEQSPGKFAQRIDNKKDSASHDIATAICCLSTEAGIRLRVFPRYLHPRDVIFYGLLSPTWRGLSKSFIWVLRLIHKQTFKKKYDVEYHLTNRKTGKLKKVDNIGWLLAKLLKWKDPYQVSKWRAYVPSMMSRNAYFGNYRFTEIKRPATSGKFLAWNRMNAEPELLGGKHKEECFKLLKQNFGFDDIMGLFALRYGKETAVYKYLKSDIESYIQENKQTFIDHLGLD